MSERVDVKNMLVESGADSGRFASLAEAERIMSQLLIGPETIKEAFGIEFTKVPAIPFSVEELEQAEQLDHQLVLFVNADADHNGLTILEMNKRVGGVTHFGTPLIRSIKPNGDISNRASFAGERFLHDVPRAGWRLVSRRLAPDSVGKDYLSQTEGLAHYGMVEVFKDMPIPEAYEFALEDFHSKRNEIAELLTTDPKVAGDLLYRLPLTKLTRETAPEAVYRLILTERKLQSLLLPFNDTWTMTRFENGDFVSVGAFGSEGMLMRGIRPAAVNPSLGTSFSRPGFMQRKSMVSAVDVPLPSRRTF